MHVKAVVRTCGLMTERLSVADAAREVARRTGEPAVGYEVKFLANTSISFPLNFIDYAPTSN